MNGAAFCAPVALYSVDTNSGAGSTSESTPVAKYTDREDTPPGEGSGAMVAEPVLTVTSEPDGTDRGAHDAEPPFLTLGNGMGRKGLPLASVGKPKVLFRE